MTEPGPHVVSITVDYHGAGQPRFGRGLTILVLALVLVAAVLLSGVGGKRSPSALRAVKPSACEIGSIPRVEAGYRPVAARSKHTACP
jgi:hypothetical protein